MGWENQAVAVFQAGNTFVINSNGEFLYNGTPALNSLISSIVPVQVTDPYGNLALAGTTSYAFSSGIYEALQINNGIINWYTAASEAGPWTIGTGIDGRDNVFNLGAATGTAGVMQEALQSNLWILRNPSVAGILQGISFVPGSGLIAGTGLALEAWKDMTSGLLNGWTANTSTPQYRMTVENEVQFRGAINGGAATAAQFFTLPAAYRPPTLGQTHAAGCTAGVIAGQSAFTQVNTTGACLANGVTPGTGGMAFAISGRFPLV